MKRSPRSLHSWPVADMRPDVRALLEANDDPQGWEVPGDDWASFPANALTESVEKVQAALSQELGLVDAVLRLRLRRD